MDAIAGDEDAQAAVSVFDHKLKARGCEVFQISAASSEGVATLMWRTMELVKEAREQIEHEPPPDEVTVTRVLPDEPLKIKEIARYADDMSEWEVSGGALERLIARFDMENPEAVLHVHRQLESKGTLEELKRAGVKVGDLVHVGEIAIAFEE
jgi:GTP-binding protein